MSDIPKVHDFKMGDTIVIDVEKIHLWDSFSDKEKFDYYGQYFEKTREKPENDEYIFSYWGNYFIKPKLFTFICEHSPQEDYGVIIAIKNDVDAAISVTLMFGGQPPQRLFTMVHLDEFRKATLEEC